MANLNRINELIEQIGNAERITKAALSELSRTVLEYIVTNDGVEGNNKGSEDKAVAERLIQALTPVNRKVAIAFFTKFLAFHVERTDDGEFVGFRGKDKKQWVRKYDLVKEFLAEPHNNIWTWADRNIEIAPKPMDFAKLNQAMGQLIKKADKAKLGHDNIVRAMLSNGITAEEMMAIIHDIAKNDPVKEEPPAPAPQKQAA